MDNMEKMIQQILAQMNDNAKANQADLLARMDKMDAKMDANMTKMAAIRSELEEIMERQSTS
jgi:hypothetical protein